MPPDPRQPPLEVPPASLDEDRVVPACEALGRERGEGEERVVEGEGAVEEQEGGVAPGDGGGVALGGVGRVLLVRG